ncbi:MAG: hypothetical protein IGS49_24265 [Chlorogloeopsis fritschii C42_A2020_084]|uniref:hypothetical protein n=1 Tax=Chlorogloeopsis fritschii TaxID=1124 RepID=UPI0019F5E00B|nr:hypothetical protein [Chlorogloeopsis fritschii]MBF2008472.1 hypothetical protein [Chlorogloeopsis fritschii C42_A2020_084]
MVNRINDIAWQARRGSVAAIIQVLNERLANSGVRTRAIFDDGVLQLLCEANTVDELEKSTLVNQVQQILESIAPRNIRRVNINSRIVREQQLLWLEEITREPENQLLWSEEIILEQPNTFQQLIRDFRDRKAELGNSNLPKTQSSRSILINNNSKNLTWRRLLFALSICSFLLLLGWVGYTLLNGKFKHKVLSTTQKSPYPVAKTSKPVNNNQEISQTQDAPKEDIFVEAVRIANQASAAGKVAKSSTQWLEIAANWQRASDLMSQVLPNHSRYKEAQIRTKLYQQYSQAAQQEAEKSKS